MSEEFEQLEPEHDSGERPAPAGKRSFRRRLAIGLGVAAVVVVLALAAVFILYRTGVGDNYIKAQFTAKMDDIGIVFDADVFRLTVAPLELQLRNATFNDKVTGEKLFFVRDARLALSITDLWAWQLSRDISIDTTDINGAEAWVMFDENGRSNFANLKFVEDEAGGAVNFRYESMRFSLRDSVIHFGDVSHSITADANNVGLFLEPEDITVPDEQKRYKIDLSSTGSRFIYDGRELTPIDIAAKVIADRQGADIQEFRLTTPVGSSFLSGRLNDWAALQYDLNIESTVDLTQTSTIFPLGATLRGVGNFKGRVTGQGENYRVDGQIDSQAVSADGVYLKGINVAATIEGTNSNYAANGTAVAEMLTFGDFRIDLAKLAGNVRGTGTDFRWLGELQAAAVKGKGLSIGGLFLSDAVAEMNDQRIMAEAAAGRAQKFSVAETEFTALVAQSLRFRQVADGFDLTAPTATAASFSTDDYRLVNIRGRDIRVEDRPGRTDVKVGALRASEAQISDTRLTNVTADAFEFSDKPASIELAARKLRAERLNAGSTLIYGLETPLVTLTDTPAETVILADNMRLAKIDAGSAVLGTLNIAGVRLTIREGRVEARSNDIDAGDVTLAKTGTLPEGGRVENVQIKRPVFVLEPSGRYRASADMSIGGGTVGSIPLGTATSKVQITNDRVDLNELTAQVMEGSLTGNAVIALNSRTNSTINAEFTGLDLSKAAALQAGRVLPLEGRTNGRIDLEMRGTDYRTLSGTVSADIAANAGTADADRIPVNGTVKLVADQGLFTVDQARLATEKTELSATGRFDLRSEDSDLELNLNSSDAAEVEQLVRIFGVSPTFEEQFDSMKAAVGGQLKFNGTIKGNLTDPLIDGTAFLEKISLRGVDLGSLSTGISVGPDGTEFTNGKLSDPDGGTLTFTASIPSVGVNNISVDAELTDINVARLLAAIPADLPEPIRSMSGKTSGTVQLSGLPKESVGEVDIKAAQGTIGGQDFDSLAVKAVFRGSQIDLAEGTISVGSGRLTAGGSYDMDTTEFDLDVTGDKVPLALVSTLIPSASVPSLSGEAAFTAKAVGRGNATETFNINFQGVASSVAVNGRPFGNINFSGVTQDRRLTAEITASLEGRPQVITGEVNFGDPNLPFAMRTEFSQGPLDPFFVLVPQLQDLAITGQATGNITAAGNLMQLNAAGERVFSTQDLAGTVNFSQLSLQIRDTPLTSVEPVIVRFNPREVTFENAKFAGGGSNMTIAGTAAISVAGTSNLSIDGRVNLSLLNIIPAIAQKDMFFSGIADVSMRLAGDYETARLSGTADIQNGLFATFFGADRVTFDRLQGRVLFASNQAQVDRMTGFLGGGQFVASGGVLLNSDLSPSMYRLSIDGRNMSANIRDFSATADAKLEISGRSIGAGLSTLVSGSIIARRVLYSKDIELANVVGARREASLGGGGSPSLIAPRFDLTIEGRDALVVQNNIADLTASVSLRLTGTTNNPQVAGRITASNGTVFFRKDRYIVQRGSLEFPPNTEIDPIVNLQAESEIAGYQVFVNLSGPLTDTADLNVNVRSSPALPQADVISLITTGSLSNTDTGIPTFAQTGINTAAEVLTDSIINNPARKATDRLFGLNVFEIDPVISGERLNPSARLTVGRQINNNLRVTYATNLSEDQNQVLAVEYRVSNKISVVAQYEQRPLGNVTQNKNNFSFEVRFRRRF